jgi:hypothetical protein
VATVQVTLSDAEDGQVSASAVYDPPPVGDEREQWTTAQHTAAVFLANVERLNVMLRRE